MRTSTTPRTQREVVWRVPRASGLFSAFGPNRLDRVSIALNLLGVRLIDGRMVFASSGQGSLGQGCLEHPKKYGASKKIVALRIRSEWQRPASDGGSGTGVVSLGQAGEAGELPRSAGRLRRVDRAGGAQKDVAQVCFCELFGTISGWDGEGWLLHLHPALRGQPGQH